MKHGIYFAIVVSTAVLAGCGSGGFSKRGAGKTAGVFTYAMPVEPTTLDPARVSDVDTGDLLNNVFEGLLAYDENNKLVGRLAEKWETPDNGKTWVFTLRKGIKFSNGREMTAEDVKWSLERACAKDFSSPTAVGYLSNIVGVEEEASGKANEISGVKVIDPSTIQISLDQARPYFLGNLTYPCSYVVAKEAAGKDQIDDIKAAVGTGPFKIAKYDHGQQVVLEANKDYYLGTPKLEKIVRPIISDASTRLNEYKAGKLLMLTLQRQDVKGIQSDPELKTQLVFNKRPAVFFVALNQNNYAPFKNVKVRRAFAMAIDKKKICDVILEGMPIANGLIPPGVFGHREDYKGIPFDPAGARKLLAEAGYPNGKGLPPFQLVFRSSAGETQRICEAIESSVRQNLNFPVKLQSLEWSAMLNARDKKQLQGYYMSWYADFLDPQNVLSFLLSSTSDQNRDGYKNAEFDRLCALGDTSLDEPTRTKYYQQAEDVVVQDGGRFPLYYQQEALLVSPKVKGIRNNALGILPHLTVSVD